jgi:pimeloyl-ACP methyl ester carboxylesterase
MQRVEAVVQTGPVETRYSRAGRGAPVLLLLDESAVNAAVSQLLETLVSEFRLLLPALDGAVHTADAEQPGFPEWLRDFMDGLGIDRFAVIATDRYARSLTSFMASDPDRIRHLVLLGSGASSAAPDAHHAGTSADGTLPPDALAALLQFLRADPLPA